MKYMKWILLFTFTMFGCEQVSKPIMPDYFLIYERFKETPEAKACEQYREVVLDEKRHPDYPAIHAYQADDEMEIVHSSVDEGLYQAKLKCVVEATYQVRSNQRVTATFEKDLGVMSFILEHDEHNRIKTFELKD